MESLRKPKDTGPSDQRPSSSGPRWPSRPCIAVTRSTSAGASLRLKSPQMPHISRALSLIFRMRQAVEALRVAPHRDIVEIDVGRMPFATAQDMPQLSVRIIMSINDLSSLMPAMQAVIAHRPPPRPRIHRIDPLDQIQVSANS